MKKTLLAVFILIFILTFGILEQVYIKKTFKELNLKLIDLQMTIDDKALSEEKINDIMDYWEENRDPLEGFVYNNDTREIVTKLGEIEGFIKAGQTDNANPVIFTLIDIIDHTIHVLEFSWHHVL